MKIRIDPEFAGLIPAVPAEQDGELEELILSEGRIRDAVVIWKHQNTMLDGHRRWRIKGKHPSLSMPKPIVMDFATRDEAHNWIIDNQLARHNMSDEQRRYLIGKKYLAHKPPAGVNQHTEGMKSFHTLTAKQIAESEGVTERTVHNAAEFAEAVDAVAEKAPEVKTKVLSGEVKATTKDLEALAELPKKQQEKAAEAIVSGEVSSVKQAISEAKPEPKKSAAMVDAEGKPVPVKLRPFFEKAPEFEAHCRTLNEIAKWVEETAATDLGIHLSANSIVADIRNVKSAIRFGKPYAVCPYCKGTGVYKHEKCGNCRGIGFVGRNKLKSAPAEMRA